MAAGKQEDTRWNQQADPRARDPKANSWVSPQNVKNECQDNLEEMAHPNKLT
jgi:hypothetical protein